MVQALQVTAVCLGNVRKRGCLGATKARYGQPVALLGAAAVVGASEATLVADVAGLGASLQVLTGIDWRTSGWACRS